MDSARPGICMQYLHDPANFRFFGEILSRSRQPKPENGNMQQLVIETNLGEAIQSSEAEAF